MRTLFLLAAGASSLAVAAPVTVFAETAAPAAKAVPASDNPMLAKWTGPFEGVPPWDKMQPSLFPAAFEAAMAEYRAEVHKIRDDESPATFKNVNEAMQLSGQTMTRLFGLWGVQVSNQSNAEVQAIDKEWSPKLAGFFDEFNLDQKLFQRHKAVYDKRASLKLTPEQLRIVERDYEGFVRRGALLTPAQKAQVTQINQDLSGAFSDFSAKVLADEETWIVIDDKADLAGLSDSFVASLKDAADERKLPGKWVVVNTRSSVQPLLNASTNRALREKVWRAFTNRGDNGNANDTNATIVKILKMRSDRAKLLGFKNHAWYRMDDTMAKDPAKAMDLMMRVWGPAVARVHQEVADMQAIADAEAKSGKGAKITIEPWDYRFYAEKVRKAKYDLDEGEIKPYLELNNILQGAFYAAGRNYDLAFKENTGEIPVFDPNVRTFAVTDKRDGSNVGVFYFDGYARAGKRSGAWMTTYRSQQGLGGEQNVLASNNNNFVKGGAGEPTLISLDDATTLFHEFGHAIHYFLQDVYYPALAETPRDFVEYPSQVNENWLLTRDVLDQYAKHYKTGEPMPQALVDKIEKSSTFNQGFETVEYLSSAILDMKIHDRDQPVTDPKAFEKATLAEIGMPKEMVMRHRLPQFNHLFADDGYSAGYYSYLWSETMDADTWAAFTEAGSPWDKATADKFRAILLSTGNETDRAEAYRAFRGRDPDVKALLKKRGFPTE
ncbi:M3 family metallopeptidase [Sphingobium boeckii]|uniref:Peptidyl-dipeptidase Dcp n=1 Tax=Sphingobium boeckii TaxID=1082345 RepID=A0A7W9AJB7_9SPHN|nr:M3 family metallopeptidase [Sphingobium boeckii]MBB5686514.1 peptidyl-dipeptidase Dcp [Sphingobium boeckii]